MLAKKIIASIACLSMVAMVAPSLSQAATAADLQAQIQALQTQLAGLMGQLGGTGGTTASGVANANIADCTGVTFAKNLTIGATGADVKCLQAVLNQAADTQVSATGAGSPGNESTYFGAKTKAAVAVFQMKNAATILTPVGLTAGTGFVGASTRAALNAMLASTTTGGGTTTTTGFTNGCTSASGYSPLTGQACSGTTTTTTTTGGPEGSITVSTNPTPANSTKVYEGDSKVAVYGLKIKATGSDMDVQRVTLEFTKQPWTYFNNVYLYNGSTQLATAVLNSTTVSKVNASDYEITLSNFASKFVVANNTTGVLTVSVDVNAGISSDAWVASTTANTIGILNPASTSVRAVDQAGLNQYSGDTVGRTISVNASQATNATLTVSLDANTPKARNIVADSSENVTGATLLTFDVQATKDNVLIDTLNAQFTDGAGGAGAQAIPNTAYLYDDSGTAIGTGTPNAHLATNAGLVSFTDLNYTVPKDTTKTFTLRIDDTVATANTTTHISGDDGQIYTVTVNGTGVSAEKSDGTSLSGTGSAVGYNAYAYAQGPIFTLTSISTSSTQPAYSGATSSISATFNIQVQAVTGDVYIPAADTSNAFTVDYGYNSSAQSANGVSVTYVQPSGSTLTTYSSTHNAYKVGQGTTATFAVGATYNRSSSVGYYDLRIQAINWAHTWDATYHALQTSNYMAGDSNWISQQVNLQ